MALTFGFYDSLNHDRLYNAQQMSAIFDGIINDGVFASVGSHFSVVPGTGMHVLVKSGRAWFNSTWTLNDSDIDLTIDAADSLLGRIDTVVLEVNSEQATRANSIKVVKGTAASTPAKPTLTNTTTVHQHPLAHITVAKNTTAITASMIEIVVGKTDCPFVTAILQTTDITNLFAKWENDFQTWFSTIRSTLDGDVALNLQNQIDANWRNTLKDATKTKLGLENDAVPDDAFNALIEDVSTTFDIGDVKITARDSLDDKWLLCNDSILDYKDNKQLYDSHNDGAFNYKTVALSYPLSVKYKVRVYTISAEKNVGQADDDVSLYHTGYSEPYVELEVAMSATFVGDSDHYYGIYVDTRPLPTGTSGGNKRSCVYLYDLDSSEEVKTPLSFFPLQEDSLIDYDTSTYYYRYVDVYGYASFLCLVDGVAIFSKTYNNDDDYYQKLFFWDVYNYEQNVKTIVRRYNSNYCPFRDHNASYLWVDKLTDDEFIIRGGYLYSQNYRSHTMIYVRKTTTPNALVVKPFSNLKAGSSNTNYLQNLYYMNIIRYVPSLDAFVLMYFSSDSGQTNYISMHPVLTTLRTIETSTSAAGVITCSVTLPQAYTSNSISIGVTLNNINEQPTRLITLNGQTYWASSYAWVKIANSIPSDPISIYGDSLPSGDFVVVKDNKEYIVGLSGVYKFSGDVTLSNLHKIRMSPVYNIASWTAEEPYKSSFDPNDANFRLLFSTRNGTGISAVRTPKIEGVTGANAFVKIKN